MACTIHAVRPFIFIHWARPELSDFSVLDGASQRLAREYGEPLVSVSILDQRTIAPDPEVRRRLVVQTRLMSDRVRMFYTVVCGTGFGATVHRSVLAGMFLLHQGPTRPSVAATVDEVLDREAGAYSVPRAEILRQLREHGLLLS